MALNTNSYILPEEILQYQICTNCKKYLSYKPVKSYASGEVKCGRCIKDNDGGYASFFDKIMEHILFPCVNRFEDCTQLLNYKDVPNHEENCIGNLYSCQICDDDEYQKNSLLCLLNHYRMKHYKNSLKVPIFSIKEKEHQNYVYSDITNNFFCVITVSFNYNILHVNFTSPTNANVKYKLELFDNFFDTKEQALILSNFKWIANSTATFCILDRNFKEIVCKLEFKINLTVSTIKSNMFSDSQDEQTQESSRCSSIIKKDDQKEVINDNNVVNLGKRVRIRNAEKVVKKFPKAYHWNGAQYSFVDISDKENFYCTFCENSFPTSSNISETYCCTIICSYKLCGQCWALGVKTCPRCSSLFTLNYCENYNIYFYCKYGCNQRFTGRKLFDHEEKCMYNQHGHLSGQFFIRSYFEMANRIIGIIPDSSLSRRNSILFDPGKFCEEGQLFVVTRDDFRFILNFWYDFFEEEFNFQVSHEYDLEKYFILIKVCENGEISEYRDTFSLPRDTLCKFFVVNLREIID